MTMPTCWAAKTDLVTLANGDRITGEVKAIEQGRLVFSTDDLGTVRIEWDKVAQLVSRRTHEVELVDGTRHFGVLRAPPAEQVPVLLIGEDGRPDVRAQARGRGGPHAARLRVAGAIDWTAI